MDSVAAMPDLVQPFLSHFYTVLTANKFGVDRHKLLEGTGLRAGCYARQKNTHLFVYDLANDFNGNFDAIFEAHRAARTFVNGLYKIPKAIRFRGPTIVSVVVTSDRFTGEMQQEAFSKMRAVLGSTVSGGEFNTAFLIDPWRRLVVPLRAMEWLGYAPLAKAQKRVETLANEAFAKLPTSEMAPQEDSETATTEVQLQTKASLTWPPAWAWLFLVPCGVIMGFGGAIPIVLGLASLNGCYQVACDRTKPVGVRILICLGITIGAWVIVIILSILLVSLFSN